VSGQPVAGHGRIGHRVAVGGLGHRVAVERALAYGVSIDGALLLLLLLLLLLMLLMVVKLRRGRSRGCL
jgi:hypothetical protein